MYAGWAFTRVSVSGLPSAVPSIKASVPVIQFVLASSHDGTVKPSAVALEYSVLPSRTLLAALVASKSGRNKYSLPSLSAAFRRRQATALS